MIELAREPEVAEVEVTGRAASSGIAIGTLVRLEPGSSEARLPGTPEEEVEALGDALAAATTALETLAEDAADDARAILEFQIALLEDEDLIDPILAETAAGTSADQAWRSAIDGEIREYRAGGDEMFAARASDLEDLRDRVLDALAAKPPEDGSAYPDGPAIVAAEDLPPSRFLELDWSRFRGAVLKAGSPAGHVALLARARGIPLVVGLGEDFERLEDGALAIVDGTRGQVMLAPLAATIAAAERQIAAGIERKAAADAFRSRPALTARGERVRFLINVDGPDILEDLDPTHVDGIGLTRTELLFASGLADEETQFDTYRRLLDWAGARPVIVRTLDAGGDKPVPGFTPVGETNPFLGVRGARLSLARPEVFKVQLRALARAAAYGPLQVMVPMVSTPRELEACRALLGEAVAELGREGIEATLPALGMMVEVPAAALRPAAFEADFYSIGSNDLIQYVMAASRDDAALADLYDPRDPGVLELIRRVVEAGRARGAEVGLCGDMASEPDLIPMLLDLGLRHLSVAPAAIGEVKRAIAGWPEAATPRS